VLDSSSYFALFLSPASGIEINALQRGSTIILQKNLRAVFGLTVSGVLMNGREHIRNDCLITRRSKDYLRLFL
jgi:hypothetical protein